MFFPNSLNAIDIYCETHKTSNISEALTPHGLSSGSATECKVEFCLNFVQICKGCRLERLNVNWKGLMFCWSLWWMKTQGGVFLAPVFRMILYSCIFWWSDVFFIIVFWGLKRNQTRALCTRAVLEFLQKKFYYPVYCSSTSNLYHLYICSPLSNSGVDL